MTDDIFEDLEAAESLLSACEKDQTEDTGKFTARTLSEVAAFFGLATQTVKQWRTESPPMPGQEGAWPLPEIVRWRHSKVVQTDVMQAQRSEQLEATKLKNEQLRAEIAARRGELIERDEVERDISIALSHVRNRLDNLPHNVSQVVPGDCKAQVIATVGEVVRLALKELSESLSELGKSSESE